MIEDAVFRKNSGKSKSWARGLRVFQCIFAVIFLITVGPGLAFAGMLLGTDPAAFVQWLVQTVVMSVPLVVLIVGMQYFITKLTVQYDYELMGTVFTAYRVTGNRRKRYVSFDLKSVSSFRPTRQEDLHGAINLSLNGDAEYLMTVKVSECTVIKKVISTTVILELTERLYRAMARDLRPVM